MLTRFKIASYVFSMCGIVFLASACNGLKNFAANGYNVDRDYSIFSRFSGSYCSLVSEPDGQNLSVNCENLRAMIDPNGDFCQKNKGKTWKRTTPTTQETKDKISTSLKGRDNSEWKEKIYTEERNQKLSESLKGREISEQTRLKMKEAAKNRWKNK